MSCEYAKPMAGVLMCPCHGSERTKPGGTKKRRPQPSGQSRSGYGHRKGRQVEPEDLEGGLLTALRLILLAVRP